MPPPGRPGGSFSRARLSDNEPRMIFGFVARRLPGSAGFHTRLAIAAPPIAMARARSSWRSSRLPPGVALGRAAGMEPELPANQAIGRLTARGGTWWDSIMPHLEVCAAMARAGPRRRRAWRTSRMMRSFCGSGMKKKRSKSTKAVALEQQPRQFVRLRGNQPLSREFALSE